MESAGMMLYAMYCTIDAEKNNCENEPWDQMDRGTQQVWETLADMLCCMGLKL